MWRLMSRMYFEGLSFLFNRNLKTEAKGEEKGEEISNKNNIKRNTDNEGFNQASWLANIFHSGD
jgi:hypothetical protein